ncbi:MAG TPA: pyridoxal-phosphate dependent enzyme [Euzebya sp.]|nr:pyridoxal-phosphate dependent enzyme [Euzebya sp.]
MRLTLPTLTDVNAAAARLDGVVRRTPVITLTLDDGRPVTLKLEHLQATGSFKARGASNAIALIAQAAGGAARRGIVAASGGNHGQAVAWAAARHGLDATVVVPASSPDAKADRIAGFGATVVRHGVVYDEAEARAREIEAVEGRTFVHAFGDPRVIAGQGTVGLEMLMQAPDCDALVIAVGGGGLVAGVGLAADGGVPVIGAEPVGAPTLHAAVAAGGVPVSVEVDTITASSLGARRTTEVTARVVADTVGAIVQVSDPQMLAARDWLWESLRVPAEVGAAAGLAAVMADLVDAAHPCVLICGANEPWSPGG